MGILVYIYNILYIMCVYIYINNVCIYIYIYNMYIITLGRWVCFSMESALYLAVLTCFNMFHMMINPS